MKKINKIIPAFACLCLLVGCSETPNLNKSSKDKTIFDSDFTSLDTYQDLFDNLYTTQGVDVAVDELLYRVAKEVLTNSDHFTFDSTVTNKIYVQKAIDKKLDDAFDLFYRTASYKENGLFDENKLIEDLRKQGYTITLQQGKTAFVETIGDMLEHDEHLLDKLGGDYTKYKADLTKDYYQDLLKEAYVLDQKYADKASYLENKDIRVVEYFTYTPANTSTEQDKYSTLFKQTIDSWNTSITEASSTASFADLVLSFEKDWKMKKLEDLAEEFALINEKANESSLPTEYAGTLGNGDLSDETNGPTGIIRAQLQAAKDLHDEDEVTLLSNGSVDLTYILNSEKNTTIVSDTKSKISTYASSGKKSMYDVYYEKQLEILTTSYYTKDIRTSDDTDLISSTAQRAIEDFVTGTDSKYVYVTTANGISIIDVNDTGVSTFKSGSNWYILTARKIDTTNMDDLYIAAEKLAKTSSNIKNCYYYYLTKLTEEGKLTIHNQDVYDYLEETYGYGVED